MFVAPPQMHRMPFRWLSRRDPGCWFVLLLTLAFLGHAEETNRLHRTDVEQVAPFRDAAANAVVLVFVRPDCPISNRYVAELRRLQKKFTPKKVSWWLVYPDRDLTWEAVRQHGREYHLDIPALLDPDHRWVKQSHVRVTPEAALFTPDQTLIYHGRIDDRFVAFGTARPEATRHDLEEALELLLQGKAVKQISQPAVGCTISQLP